MSLNVLLRFTHYEKAMIKLFQQPLNPDIVFLDAHYFFFLFFYI